MKLFDIPGRSPDDWIRRHASQRPRRVALVWKGSSYSYEALGRHVSAATELLSQQGVVAGSRVAIWTRNCPAFLITWMACAALDAIAVPVNFRLSGTEVEYILDDAQASVVVYQSDLAADAGLNWPEETCRIGVESDGVSMAVVRGSDATASRQRDATKDSADPDLLIIYTSGTTGQPKGAVLTKQNLLFSVLQYITGISLVSDDVTYAVPPLFHIAGLCVTVAPLLYLGGTIVLGDKFDPAEALDAIERHRVTKMFLVPQMWAELRRQPDIEQRDLSSLQCGLVGSAPCPLPVIEYFQGRGVRFQEGFGMSETTSACTLLPSHLVATAAGSVGFPLAHIQARIVDEDGHDVEDGAVGELIVKGPNVMRAYWRRMHESNAALLDGWLRTGDLARRSADGLLWIVDRKKDMLISGGENVYPTEVEQVLCRHPDVREVAVIGLPDERFGEVVTAVVVPNSSADLLSVQRLREFCSGKLAPYKHPRSVRIVPILPRTATGKVLKRELRMQFAGSPEAVYRDT